MPLLSVVMSTYNRENLVKETIDSVLAQTFEDFEFIIIDDFSSDSTFEVLSSYDDKRIHLYKNSSNKGCTFNYHIAQNLAKGKYIAHIDDDDICMPTRFEKQINYLENNPDISLLGTFVETFGENVRPSWVFYTEPEKIDFLMNFYNPICHSSIIYDKSFADKNFINYDLSCKCAQDYDFYKQFILKGGKIANLDEVLVKYRMHKVRLTDVYETQQVQISVAEKVKERLLSRFLSYEEIIELKKLLFDFPYNNYDKQSVLNAFKLVKEKALLKKLYSEDTIDSVIFDIKNNLFSF